MHRFFALFLAFMILAGSVAFAEGLNIVCTSFPCYDFARAVIGNEENIRLLIKPGAEVHAYEPAPSDILALADCDLFIYIGGESDAWVEDILDSFGADAPETLRLFDCVEAVEAEHEDDHHDMQYDEHIWTSPVNAQRMIAAIAEKLAAIDSARSQLYADNAELYIQQVSEIDSEIRSIVADSERKEFVFADRFPFIYLAEEYGLSYISAFPSCSAESEPSAKTMMMLMDKIVSDKIPVIYTIELSTGKTAKAISEETGVKIMELHSVQTLTEKDFSAGESYVTLMRKNVEALREGLN